jgi:hemolysin activation/secretion protein
MGLDLTVDLAGQVVTRGQSLWASAECSFGGQVYGRGFETGLLGGDSCIKASVELSKRFQLSRFTLAPYIFADGGRVGQNGPLEFGEVREAIATSGGVGIRVTVPDGLSLDIQYARPQENPAPAMPRYGRWFFTLGYKH